MFSGWLNDTETDSLPQRYMLKDETSRKLAAGKKYPTLHLGKQIQNIAHTLYMTL